ncbi:DUF2846 domain-containing protein [Vibrio parahaemolyticus]
MEIAFQQINIDDFELCVAARKDAYFCSFGHYDGFDDFISGYREDTFVGAALKKYVYVDGECIGETAPGIFFYHEVEGNKEHQVSTESEFSENHLTIYTEEGRNYFVNQYIKMGVFVGGAGVELVDENKGKAEVLKVDMAVKGKCPSI